MPAVYLLATAAGQVAIECKKTILLIAPDLGKPLAVALRRAVAAARAGRFDLIHVGDRCIVVSGPNRVALCDSAYRRAIFVTANGAQSLAKYLPRYCDLARVLGGQNTPHRRQDYLN